ncbi:putative zinc finger protein [Apostasia shenzhenica]|uniref:Putative zinc finger protein n=1 Tax=Apostasia shenzhenica TaxID=1088818 RepID=A0A2I0ACV5_9ASPA|nr:putative zinc finger protein [Apostasia shenzhenica]
MVATSEGDDKSRPIFRDIRRYYCEYCGICRSKKSLIMSHMQSHHQVELKKVAVNEVHAQKQELRQKLCYACEECDAIFKKPSYLLQHKQSHSVERLFTCPLEDCHSSYRRKDHLNRHLLKHQGRIFNCPTENCNQKFSYKGNVIKHVKNFHDDNASCEGEKKHVCQVPGCGNAFKHASQLWNHKDSHGERLHVCQEPGCGKAFKYPSRLRKHEDSHVKLECLEIICGEPGCLKFFTNAEFLKAHVRSCHKYFKCEVCGSQQLRKNFKRHQIAHKGFLTERLKCRFDGCDHTFSNKSNLNKHVKAIHKELKPFSCHMSGCGLKFTYKHVRDNHERTHIHEQGDFLEVDSQRSRQKGGRKRQRISIEMLTRKRIVPLDQSSILDSGTDYLRWLLSGDDQ